MNRDVVIRRAAMGGVILSATVLSYVTLKHRAEAIGIASPFSWFYPLAFDALILGASRTWQNSELSDSTRRMAKWVTLGAIGAAVAAFVAEFVAMGWVAVAFAVIIPAALAASLVLTSRAAADRRNQHDNQHDVEQTGGSYAKTSVTNGQSIKFGVPTIDFAFPPPADPELWKEASTNGHQVLEATTEQKRAWIEEQIRNGVDVTGAMVDRQFPGKSRNGARLVKQVKEKIIA